MIEKRDARQDFIYFIFFKEIHKSAVESIKNIYRPEHFSNEQFYFKFMQFWVFSQTHTRLFPPRGLSYMWQNEYFGVSPPIQYKCHTTHDLQYLAMSDGYAAELTSPCGIFSSGDQRETWLCKLNNWAVVGSLDICQKWGLLSSIHFVVKTVN